MVLPASGAITFAQIATELGRTGTTVAFNQADVAALAGKTTTSTIILPNDFWGKSATDYVPNAVNWGELIDFSSGSAFNAPQTISGISPSITLNLSFSIQTATNLTAASGLRYVKNNGSEIVWWTASGNHNSNANVVMNNNDVIYFSGGIAQANGELDAYLTGTVTVTNTSSSNTVLDTFNVNLSVFAGGPIIG